jgi:transketolase
MSLRMIPNLEVFRPADVVETAECWQLALENGDGPSVLALSRQNLPQLRDSAAQNLSAKGGYTLVASASAPRAVLIATGSEVEIAVAAAKLLETQGVPTNVVSMPSLSRFLAQDAAYRDALLPKGALRVSIEAGTTFGWGEITGLGGVNIGINQFGLSAPAPALYDHFGLNAQTVAARVAAALD